jgi:acyl carrier protein
MLIAIEDVCGTVGLVLGKRGVSADDRIVEQLGAESLDVLGIMLALEEKYGVAIDEAAMAEVSTVRELYEVVRNSPHGPTPAANPSRSA